MDIAVQGSRLEGPTEKEEDGIHPAKGLWFKKGTRPRYVLEETGWSASANNGVDISAPAGLAGWPSYAMGPESRDGCCTSSNYTPTSSSGRSAKFQRYVLSESLQSVLFILSLFFLSVLGVND